VQKFWRKLEDQTTKILSEHAPEVHAVAQALLDRSDLTGKQTIEIIKTAAAENTVFDSERLLKDLVEETIVNPNGEDKPEKKPTPKRKTMKAKTE
jgi:hypothetical protein